MGLRIRRSAAAEEDRALRWLVRSYEAQVRELEEQSDQWRELYERELAAASDK